MTVPARELHRVVPSVIIYNAEGKFLLAKRSPALKHFPGKWHVPGGGLSMDDYEHLPSSTTNDKQWYLVIDGALRREVREEVGIEIGKPQYLLDVAFVRSDGIPVIVLTYYAPYASGDIKLSEEAETYDLIDGILGELKMVDNILHGNTIHTSSR